MGGLYKSSLSSEQKNDLIQNMIDYFNRKLYRQLSCSQLNNFSILKDNDKDRLKFTKIFKFMKQSNFTDFQSLNLNIYESRGIGCLLGLAIADALGASTQFIPFDKNRKDLIVNGFQDITKLIKNNILSPRSGKVGIWTDDTSMALCIADSLIINKFKFQPKNIRYLFTLWLNHGLNNGGRPQSIGLGGNIAISMKQFISDQVQYAQKGNQLNNGNGSLMRLAPIPIAFYNQQDLALQISQSQSKTTHNGDEAKQCCRLLALIIIRLINKKQQENWKQTVEKACNQFKSQIKSVEILSKSKIESQQQFQKQKQRYGQKFTYFNKNAIQDRNWDWKNKNFTYSKNRHHQKPHYVGSYCMDALAMALHIVWHTKSYKEAVIWSANMGGDCDTVGAIAGQIAGAAYGVDNSMLKLYSEMQDFKLDHYEVFLKGYKLINRKSIQ